MSTPTSTGIGAPGNAPAPANLGRSPMSSQPGNAQAAIPFTRGSTLATMKDASVTFTAGQTTTIPLSSLTANDTGTTDATFASITTPTSDGAANGSFTTVPGGISYTPARSGTATFTYQLRNSAGVSNIATVRLTVGGNNTPVTVNDTLSQSFIVGQTTLVQLSALTANDINTAGGTLENLTTPASDNLANGTIARVDAGFTYTPVRAGTVTFTYQIRTGAGISNVGVVTVTVRGAN